MCHHKPRRTCLLLHPLYCGLCCPVLNGHPYRYPPGIYIILHPPNFFRLLLLRRLRLPLLITEARCGIMTTGLRVHAPARCVPVLAPSNALQLESAEKPASVT